MPRGIAFDDFADVYLSAYEQGCKGCTTYRPNEVTGAVLSFEEPKDAIAAETVMAREKEPELPLPAPEPRGGVIYMTRPLDRPEELVGHTYKLKWGDSDHAFYITINDIERDGRRRPFEVFINSKNMEAYAWALALTFGSTSWDVMRRYQKLTADEAEDQLRAMALALLGGWEDAVEAGSSGPSEPPET